MTRTSQRGIVRLDKNKYLVRVVVVDPRTGFRKEVKRRIEGTAADAERARVAIREELLSDTPKPEKTRLREFMKKWLAARAPSLKPATHDKYEQAIGRHIAPALGDYYVSELRPSDVAKFVADQTAKLAGWTVINQLRLLRTLSKDAQAEGLTDRDFCARVLAPRGKAYTYDEPNLLTGHELGELLARVTKQWRALVLVMATTGLRWGEVSALRWDDIDEANGVIHVRRNNWKGEIGEPKTIGSRRTVGLAPEVADALREQRQRMMKKQHRGLERGWVFPARDGELHTGTPLRKVLQQACAKAGITKRLTAHGLRRTFNDLGRRVANREVVKSITGHATDRMFEHYSLVGHDEKRAVASNVLRLAGARNLAGKSEGRRGPSAPHAPEVEHPVEHGGGAVA